MCAPSICLTVPYYIPGLNSLSQTFSMENHIEKNTEIKQRAFHTRNIMDFKKQIQVVRLPCYVARFST